MLKKELNRKKRHFKIRKRVIGSADVPRVCVKRSLTNFSAQIIDDVSGKTLVGLGTNSKEIKEKCSYGGNVAAAKALGESLGAKAKELGISKVCFDRAGYQYKGRVKAFADAMREQSITF